MSRTASVDNFGDLASSLDIKSLCLLTPATFLPFMVPSIFSLSKRGDYKIVFLCYLVNYFLCRGMNVSPIWICFISKWNAPLPLSPHLLRTALSES